MPARGVHAECAGAAMMLRVELLQSIRRRTNGAPNGKMLRFSSIELPGSNSSRITDGQWLGLRQLPLRPVEKGDAE